MTAEPVLLEIGTEEIPARFLPQIRRDLAEAAAEALTGIGLAADVPITVSATPRRLVVRIAGVPDVIETAPPLTFGPPVASAFDAAGKPTPAAVGFARKFGVEVGSLGRAPNPKGKGEVVTCQPPKKTDRAADVLPAVLTAMIGAIKVPKAMRWPQSDFAFARPIRWLIALHGSRNLGVRCGEVVSGLTTRGRRFVHPDPLPVASAAAYPGVQQQAGIILDERERKSVIRTQADALAASAGGRVFWDEDLLSEVADLVEAPIAILGTFPQESLEVPQEVLIASMMEHQRYFPLVDAQGKLLPRFITVANGVKTPAVVAGNERVLKARLADARFFYMEDRKKRLADILPGLTGVVWQNKAGSMQEKSVRLAGLAGRLAAAVGAEPNAPTRAAQLCKADLITQMVFEFPTLQGVMGGLYAAADGEPAPVARAIGEHYRPAGPQDDVPQSEAGAVLALADKLDTLVGHLALGHAPSGSADPYALRRAALGVIRIVSDRSWRLGLHDALRAAADGFAAQHLAVTDAPGTVAAVTAFLRDRLDGVFTEQGFMHDEIQASLVDFDDLVLAGLRLKALAQLRHRPGFRETAFALSRVTNILPKGYAGGTVNVAGLDAEERTLYAAWDAIHGKADELAHEANFEAMYDLLAALKPAIDRFFDAVMVMDPDTAVRERRLALLWTIQQTIRAFADVRALIVA